MLHFLNLLFILHNIWKYVYGLKMKRPLIVIFYSLMFLTTVSRIIEFILRIANPEQSTQYTQIAIYNVFNFASLAASYTILTLVLTMHWLSLTLKLLLGEISLRSMRRSERTGIGFTVAYGCACLAFQISKWVYGPER